MHEEGPQMKSKITLVLSCRQAFACSRVSARRGRDKGMEGTFLMSLFHLKCDLDKYPFR